MEPRRWLKSVAIPALGVLLFWSCMVRTAPTPPDLLRQKISKLALHLAGIPYRSGGNDIEGFDCSGFVAYVYDCFGVKLPRSAKEQAKLKCLVSLTKARPADILAFRIQRGWHTAIFLGENRFAHAPTENSTVRLETLNGFWLHRLRKVIDVLGH